MSLSTLSHQWIMVVVAAVLLALVLKDLIRERRLTLAAKIRLLVVLIFVAALAWNQWH